MANTYIKIKEKEIPVIIRNYRNTNSIKIYFRGNVLNISKSKYLSKKRMLEVVKQNEEQIYKQYLKIISKENDRIKHWYSGEKISYKGEDYIININYMDKKRIKIMLDKPNKIFELEIPEILNGKDNKDIIDKYVKRFLCIKTKEYLEDRLPYWSKKMKIEYNICKVGDAISKYGSCIPSKKALHFSNRLIMLPKDKIDAIIVHELSHMSYANHSKQFYNLVQEYIPNYFEIDKWLKKNVNKVMI